MTRIRTSYQGKASQCVWRHTINMCRAFLSPWYEKGGMHPIDENDKPIFEGRCNLGVVSLHLPMILAKARKEKLPIVDKDFNLKGLITIKDIEKQIKYPLSAKDAQGRLLCGAAIGITANCLERAQALVDAKVMWLFLIRLMDIQQTCFIQ